MITAFKSTQVGDSFSIKENINSRNLLTLFMAHDLECFCKFKSILTLLSLGLF